MSAPQLDADRHTAQTDGERENSDAALSIRDLHMRFGDHAVLAGIDLDVAPGEVVGVLGANGSGKSTMLRCVVGLATPTAGSIRVAGHDATRHRAAMVFQKIHLVPRRTVLQNVCAGALGRLDLSHSWSTWSFDRSVREEAMACLDRVGLADRAHHRAGRLSGGQQQRVAIARALCQRAPVVLADEPVSALDPASAEQVMRTLVSLAGDGIAVVAVLHQPDLARRHCDRLVGIADGGIAFDGRASDIDDLAVQRLYLADGTTP